jgi:hypothetical protein
MAIIKEMRDSKEERIRTGATHAYKLLLNPEKPKN